MDGTEITYKKNYIAGSKQIAVRTITGSTNTLNWLVTDHLGSTSVSANEDGSWNSTIKYTAFGCPCAARRVLRNTRETSGVTPTKYRYTGQLLEAEVGLYYYVARFYDPVTMHFTQADTIVPNATDSASYDRYAYVLNNPVRYSDPSGHVCDDMGNCVVNRGERTPNSTRNNQIYNIVFSPNAVERVKIIPRESWNAHEPGSYSKAYEEGYYSSSNIGGYKPYDTISNSLANTLDTIVIHYEGDVSVMDAFPDEYQAVLRSQEIAMEKGSYDCDYHYIITPSGKIFEGRNIGVRGSHVSKEAGNTGKIGILWLGVSGSRSGVPTEAQYAATVNLIEYLDDQYGIDNIYSHRELEQSVNSYTICPGDNAISFVNELKDILR